MIRLCLAGIFALTLSVVSCEGTAHRVNLVMDHGRVEARYAPQAASRSDSSRQETDISYEIPKSPSGLSEIILKRVGYTVSYNAGRKVPNWVAWHLTRKHTMGRNKRDGVSFQEDPDVPSPKATNGDYYNSRYDRGHMCPAGDNKWSAEAMRQSFYFTNICPQNQNLNRYEWNDVEQQCREWAKEYGAIDICCGPIFEGKGRQKTIGKNKVWVPDAFFKCILYAHGKDSKAIAFIYPNRSVKQDMSACVVTVDEVERRTGIDFFPTLPDDVENRVEATARLADW